MSLFTGSGGVSGNRGIQLMPLPLDDVWGSSNGINEESRQNLNSDVSGSLTTIC